MFRVLIDSHSHTWIQVQIDRYWFRQIQVHIGLLLYNNNVMQRRKKVGLSRETRPVLLHGYVFCRRRGFTAMSSSSWRGIQCRLPMHNAVLHVICLPTYRRCLYDMYVISSLSIWCMEEYLSHELCMSVSMVIWCTSCCHLIFYMDKSFYVCG